MTPVNPLAATAVVALLLLAFVPPTGASDLTGGVLNVAPTLTSVTLSSTGLTPTAGSTTTLTVTVVAADLNGFNDISSVAVTILKPDASTTEHASAAASFQSGSATSATYSASLSMQFHDDPALILLTGYQVKVVVTDAASATVNNLAALSTFTYAKLAALSAPASVDTGSDIAPGESSDIATMSITNYGNVRIDLQLSGTAPDNDGTTIPVSSVEYSVNSDMASSTALSGTPATIAGFDLAKGASSAKDTYWQMTIPSGSDQYVPAGTYTSVLTVTAVEG